MTAKAHDVGEFGVNVDRMGLGNVEKSAELLLHVAMIRKKAPLARLSIKRAEP